MDDDQPLREALGSLMKAAGFLTKTFGSAEDFLACEDCDDTACLILDVRLPGMSGIELQRQLAAGNRRLPVIMITAHGDESLRNAVMRNGAAGFLNKPVRSDALLKQIHAALQNSSTDQQP